ncbi:hypothetical protein P7C70_g3621, partial [Phenoliferia sp. Uapishka_3]
MLYHASSFIEHGFTTYIVAYRGASLPKALAESSLVHMVYLPTPFAFVGALPRPLFLLLAPVKVLHAAFALFWALTFRIKRAPSFLLIQNPPAVPTLPIVKCVGSVRKSKVVIDWHNTGYSVLSLRLGPQSPVVKVAQWIETFFGRKAFAHLCVTEAMKKKLQTEAGIKIPRGMLEPCWVSTYLAEFALRKLFSRLDVLTSPSLTSFFAPKSFSSTTTPFTMLNSSSSATLSSNRPALLVSATSWTADEDFSILLSALSLYDYSAKKAAQKLDGTTSALPKILVVITGKGAGKAAFEAQVREKEKEGGWEHVRVRTAWLAIEDYPKLLGSADLGISLHASTSGADLPMKVVDMFGCGLPVCALDFACIGELVKDGVNGKVFSTPEQLADQLENLLSPSISSPSRLEQMRANIKAAREVHRTFLSWEENWDEVVSPILAP